ncbi:MAG: prepilin-type N-terminal cleavage/methylation domain-containing protein [Patescibacteria group bacterium]|nr:prepilin-type N-terminal cleavage/methylation domain-containing protein [Patescibacteria group bacterium]
MPKSINKKGFTLIELLIVIAIISIIAAVVFVALDPLTRFRDSRDAKRWADITAVLSAVKIDQVDNGGDYLSAVKNLSTNTVYMITGEDSTSCGDATNCKTDIASDSSCVNLSELVTQGYLGSVPVSPNGEGSWGIKKTGYTIEKSATGILTVRACEGENTTEIRASR